MAFPSASLEPPTLEDFQWHYNGLTFGAATPIATLKIEGIDLAEIRSGDVGWSRDYGQARGLDLLGGRDIIFDLWCKTNGTSLRSTLLELAKATGVRPSEELPLWFQLPGLPILAIMCRPRKRPYAIDADFASANVATPELVLHATDPRIYGAGEVLKLKPKATSIVRTGDVSEVNNKFTIETEGTVGIVPGMLVESEVYPIGTTVTKVLNEEEVELSSNAIVTTTGVTLTFRGSSFSTGSATNSGNIESRPIVTFDGPLARPKIQNNNLSGKPFVELLNAPAEILEEEAEEKREEEDKESEATKQAALRKTAEEVRKKWEKSEASLEEKEEAEKALKEAEEKEPIENKEARESSRKEEEHTRSTKELKGELPTVKAGDKIRVDFGTPHIVRYIPASGPAVNAAGWISPSSAWWDLVPDPEENELQFSSFDAVEVAGEADVEYAPAYEL